MKKIKKIAKWSIIGFVAFTALSVAVAVHEDAKLINEYNNQIDSQENPDQLMNGPRVLETIVRNS